MKSRTSGMGTASTKRPSLDSTDDRGDGDELAEPGEHRSRYRDLLGAVLFIGLVAAVWQLTLIPEETQAVAGSGVYASPGAEAVTVWPAGPLSGSRPVLVEGELDDELCSQVTTDQSITIVPDKSDSTIWVYADLDAEIRFDWEVPTGPQWVQVSRDYLAHEAHPGRVTVTMVGTLAPETIDISSLNGSASICGLAAS